MITTQHARQALHGFEPDALRDLVGEVLLGKRFLPLSARGFDEMPEDVFVAILSAPEAPERPAILDGLIRFLAQVAAALFDSTRPLADELRPALDHLAALISLANPPDLKSRFLPLVELAIKDTRLDPKLRASLVRPAVSYASPGDEPHLWETCITQPDLAAYGFSALLRIDPASARIPQHLKQLWVGKLEGRLPIFVADLTRRAIKARGSDAWVKPMFKAIAENHPDLIPQLREELTRHPWSAPWAQGLPHPEPATAPFQIELLADYVINYDSLLAEAEYIPAFAIGGSLRTPSVAAADFYPNLVSINARFGDRCIGSDNKDRDNVEHFRPNVDYVTKVVGAFANNKSRVSIGKVAGGMLSEIVFNTAVSKDMEMRLNRLNRATAHNYLIFQSFGRLNAALKDSSFVVSSQH